jgi:hypothetical protein
MLGNTVFSFSPASPGQAIGLEGGAIVHIAFFAWVAIK